MQPKAVGARLRHLRETANLSAAELCRTLNINRGSYSMFERGKRIMPEHLKVRIADFYGTTLDHITLGRISSGDLRKLIGKLHMRRQSS